MDSPAIINSLIKTEEHSAGNLIAIAFPKSPSRQYSETVAIAQRAKAYGEFYLGKKLYHSAVFGTDKTQASYAYMVIDASKNWKGTKLFAQGRILVSNYQVSQVLQCFLDSLVPNDHRAHCHFVDPDLTKFQFGKGSDPEDRHLIPCRMLQGWSQRIYEDRVSNLPDAVTQLAVRKNCYWCPHFDPTATKQGFGYPNGQAKAKRSLLTTPLWKLLFRFWD